MSHGVHIILHIFLAFGLASKTQDINGALVQKLWECAQPQHLFQTCKQHSASCKHLLCDEEVMSLYEEMEEG
jgi:hypothetical protein